LQDEITERKRIEKILVRNEARLNSIFRAAPTGIGLVSNGVFNQVNKLMCEILGYSQEELLEEKLIMLYPTKEEYEGMEKEKYRQIEKEGKATIETRWKRKDGKIIDVLLISTPLNPSDLSAGVTFTALDITARKKAAVELANAKEKAESADKLKSTFLATMSHELRTPLNSIIGFTGIILQELCGPLNEEQKKQLVMVRNSGRHLLSLINDVLDISKIESGQLQLLIEPFDLRETIKRVVETVSSSADQKGLAFEIQIAPEVDIITSDKRRVEQILLNLLSNAVKFTEKGMVRSEYMVKDDFLVTHVIDTGKGIKPEDMDKLFKPFQQIDSSLEREYEGTGLGLSICKRLLDLLGGEIRVESKWGKGSIFTFKLPIKIKA
jgi:PAS domain S-box-containing protein